MMYLDRTYVTISQPLPGILCWFPVTSTQVVSAVTSMHLERYALKLIKTVPPMKQECIVQRRMVRFNYNSRIVKNEQMQGECGVQALFA